MAEVRFTEVTCVFRGASRAALDNVDLIVRNGELFVLTGPPGSGKSTLVRLLAGLERVRRGRVHVGSHEVTNVAPDKRGVALISGGLALFPRLSVADNIALPLTLRRASGPAVDSMVQQAAERCGLTAHLTDVATELDFELRLRTALARAIVRRPQVVCLDDPLDADDARHTARLVGLIARLQRELGFTLVYATDNPCDVRRIADRIGVLDRGRLSQADVPARVFERPATLAVAELVCAGEMNFVETVVHDGIARLGGLSLPIGEERARALTGERVVVGIRCCDLVIGAPEGLSAVVMRVRDLGSHSIILVRAEVFGLPIDLQIRHVGSPPRSLRRVIVGTVAGQAHFFDRATGRRLPD